jgi:hypothetical protein
MSQSKQERSRRQRGSRQARILPLDKPLKNAVLPETEPRSAISGKLAPVKAQKIGLKDQRVAHLHTVKKAKYASDTEQLDYDLGRAAAASELLSEAGAASQETIPAEELLEVLFDLIDRRRISVAEGNRALESLRSVFKEGFAK